LESELFAHRFPGVCSDFVATLPSLLCNLINSPKETKEDYYEIKTNPTTLTEWTIPDEFVSFDVKVDKPLPAPVRNRGNKLKIGMLVTMIGDEKTVYWIFKVYSLTSTTIVVHWFDQFDGKFILQYNDNDINRRNFHYCTGILMKMLLS